MQTTQNAITHGYVNTRIKNNPSKEGYFLLWTTVDSIRTMFMQEDRYIYIPDLSSHSLK